MSRTIALVASLFLGGFVVDHGSGSQGRPTSILRNGISPNGISPNGISPNGISPNGISPNGISPNGISPNGISPNGISPNGISPNGISPNGISPNGISPNGISPNGISPNGISPNGISPNGISPNGISPNGISPNGISPNGISPNGLRTTEVMLHGIRPLGRDAAGHPLQISDSSAPLSGPALVGSMWTGQLSNGATVALRIDAVRPGTGANHDVWAYRMSVSNDGAANGAWRPLCADAQGDASFADSVHGTWSFETDGSYNASSSDFTLACRGSAIAKCVELGYKPWNGHARELASCVRALRGDYCGDGRGHTVDGTLVNLYDAGGVQTDGAAWRPEAEWTPDGAACISAPANTRANQVAHHAPACFGRAVPAKNSCGTGFADGATIITELPVR